jgi:hypothetical protein
LNHSATILVSNANRRLNYFKRFLLCVLCFLVLSVLAFFIFEKQVFDVLVPFMPMTQGKSPEYYADLFRLAAYESMWIAGILFTALVLYSAPSAVKKFEMLEAAMAANPQRFIATLTVVYICLLLSVSYFSLQQFPNSSDEYVYLYQADILREGKLWDASHPVEKSFAFNHIAVKDRVTVGRFPPGWPLILAVFTSMGIQASLVNPVLSIVTLILFYRFALRKYGPAVAGWSALTLSLSSFYIFNSASYFSHSVCLLATVIFVGAVDDFLEKRQIGYGLLAGICLGVISTTRYYTALLIFIPFFVVLQYQLRWRALGFFLLTAAGAIPFFIFLLWYNYAITGNALEPVTMWGYKGEGIGFINGHTFIKGLEHILRRLAMFTYWCSPVLILLYVFFLLRKIARKSTALAVPEDYLLLMLMIGYFFYYEIGGNQYGPRFYFEALPFLIVFVVYKIFYYKKDWAKVLLYASVFIAVVKLPAVAVRENRIVVERKDVYRIVREMKISNAVVLLSSGTGVLRPMPSGDLTRNDLRYENDVLYAIDHIHANGPLMDYYKDRRFYRYLREPGKARGKLIRIR